MRDIIFHAHIFKNAGTTIDSILQNNFGDRFLEDRNDEQIRSDPEYVRKTILNNPRLAAMSSHSVRLPLGDIEGIAFHTLVMLRDPLLRIRSVYDFERQQKAQTPGAVAAKKMNFKEYVSWRMLPEVPATIRNMQTKYLLSNRFSATDSLTQSHLQEAISFLDENRLIGIVERFETSMNIFENYLSGIFAGLNFSYTAKNVSNTSQLSREVRLEKIQEELGSNLMHKVVQENQFDIELYSHMERVLHEREDSL